MFMPFSRLSIITIIYACVLAVHYVRGLDLERIDGGNKITYLETEFGREYSQFFNEKIEIDR